MQLYQLYIEYMHINTYMHKYIHVRTPTVHTYQVGVIPQPVEVHQSAKHGSNIEGFMNILQ